MEMSEKINDLVAGLAKAQGEFKPVLKNREVDAGKYKYSYATLDAIVDAVREPLSKNGLAFCQGIDGSDNGSVVETLIIHTSGQWIKSIIPCSFGNESARSAQAMGSGISYAKRYALTAMLGIVTEDDDDGEQADENIKVTKKEQKLFGPLGKTDLKKTLMKFAGDLAKATEDADPDQLEALLESYKDVLEQCQRDMPDWWKGATYLKDYVPLETRIKAARTACKQSSQQAAE